MPFNIYVLKLSSDKIYVGITTKNTIDRFAEHCSGTGSEWTKLYKPIEIINSFSTNNRFDEDRTTFIYMKLYGINNVRGGSFTSVVLNEEEIRFIVHVFSVLDQFDLQAYLKGIKYLVTIYLYSSSNYFLVSIDQNIKPAECNDYKCDITHNHILLDDLYIAISYVNKYGYDKVHSVYNINKNILIKMAHSLDNSCFKCGSTLHYVYECPHNNTCRLEKSKTNNNLTESYSYYPKHKLLEERYNSACRIFSKNYNEHFSIDSSESALLKLFSLVRENTNSVFCEYLRRTDKATPKVDIDTFEDIEKVTLEVINGFKNGLKKENKKLNFTPYIFESPPKTEKNQLKYSRHIVIRGDDWCFNSKRDISAFIQKHKIPHCDPCVYGDTLFRVPYSSKPNQNRFALPIKKYCNTDEEMFKFGLMGYVTDEQLRTIIKIAPEPSPIKIPRAITTTNTHSNLDKKEIDMFKKAFEINIYKKYNIHNKTIYYYNQKCLVCNMTHTVENGQYVYLGTNLYDLITVTFKCWNCDDKNATVLRFWVNRSFTHIIHCNRKYDGVTIDNVLEMAKYYGFDIIKDIKMNIPQDISPNLSNVIISSDMHVNKNIWLSEEEVIWLKAMEGKGKSYSMADHLCNVKKVQTYNFNRTDLIELVPELKAEYDEMLKFKQYVGKKFIIASPNIATLASIEKSLKKRNIEYNWYTDTTINQTRKGKFSILLTTINSLAKFGPIVYNPQQYVFWNDEVSHTIRYIDSDTLKECRREAYLVYTQLIEFSHKVFMTCADLKDVTISMFHKYVDRSYVVHYNNTLNNDIASRDYTIMDSIAEFKKIIDRKIEDNKSICILTDSIKTSKKMYLEVANAFNSFTGLPNHLKNYIAMQKKNVEYCEILKKDYRKIMEINKQYIKILKLKGNYVNHLKIFEEEILYPKLLLINSARNNTREFLSNIDDYVTQENIKVMIASPTLSVGLSIDAVHFDNLFAIFSGKSVTAESGQQLLDRVRTLKDNDHYLHFIRPQKMSFLTSMEELNRIYKNIIDGRNQLANDLQLSRKILPGTNNFVIKNDDLITSIFMSAIVERNESLANFKSLLVSKIVQRGATVNIVTHTGIEHSNANKKIYKKMDKALVKLEREELLTILNTPLLTDGNADILKRKSKDGNLLSELEKKQLIKKQFYNMYYISPEAKINEVVNFLTNEVQFKHLDFILNNWYNFFFDRAHYGICETEVDAKNGTYLKIHKLLCGYLKKMGFTRGVLSQESLGMIKKPKIKGKHYLVLRNYFNGFGDKAQYKGSYDNKIALMKYVGKLCHIFYGVDIKYDSTVKKINGVSTRVNNNFRICIDPIVSEYVTLRFSRIINKKMDNEFIYSHIHAICGKYSEYTKRLHYSFVNI
jgi:hypothetical protein